MANKKIINIGMTLPKNDYDITHTNWESKTSLLDYDIIIIDPSIDSILQKSSCTHQKKPVLMGQETTYEFYNLLEYWNKEIKEALEIGKNIFIFLNKKKDFLTYDRDEYDVFAQAEPTSYSSYDIFLESNIDIKLINRNGKNSEMKLAENSNEITAYWQEMGGISEYRVTIERKALKPLIKTKHGNKVVGGMMRPKDNTIGHIFLLPYIDFNDFQKYQKMDINLINWTQEACNLSQNLIEHIIAIDKAVKNNGEASPPPSWLNQEQYMMPNTKELHAKITPIENQIEKLQQEKATLEQQIKDEDILKRLLYETGKPLEHVVRLALNMIGFKVSHYDDGNLEIDGILESDGKRFIVEVEGKDNKAIDVNKIRQLSGNIDEDYNRDGVEEMAKGVLIGNAHRLKEPHERTEFFTTKCITFAKSRNIALVKSNDLFNIVQYLSVNIDEEYKIACRKAILDSIGEVEFPEIPK